MNFDALIAVDDANVELFRMDCRGADLVRDLDTCKPAMRVRKRQDGHGSRAKCKLQPATDFRIFKA